MARILIGTSGWTYPSWRGAFYPENLPSRRYLSFYTREFPTTEVNYSFYHDGTVGLSVKLRRRVLAQ